MATPIPTNRALPGDLVFCHSRGIIGWAIRLGELLRWRPGARWNHVAILDTFEGGEWTVIQAEARGVTRGALLDTVAPRGVFELVANPGDRAKSLQFAREQVGRKYGFVTIASVVVSILSPKFLDVMVPRTWICSALGAGSLLAGGWWDNWADLYEVTPAELWDALP